MTINNLQQPEVKRVCQVQIEVETGIIEADRGAGLSLIDQPARRHAVEDYRDESSSDESRGNWNIVENPVDEETDSEPIDQMSGDSEEDSGDKNDENQDGDSGELVAEILRQNEGESLIITISFSRLTGPQRSRELVRHLRTEDTPYGTPTAARVRTSVLKVSMKAPGGSL